MRYTPWALCIQNHTKGKEVGAGDPSTNTYQSKLVIARTDSPQTPVAVLDADPRINGKPGHQATQFTSDEIFGSGYSRYGKGLAVGRGRIVETLG